MATVRKEFTSPRSADEVWAKLRRFDAVHELAAGFVTATEMEPGGARMVTFANGSVVVAGEFVLAGALAAQHVAQWDGSTWSAFGAGADAQVNIVVPAGGGEDGDDRAPRVPVLRPAVEQDDGRAVRGAGLRDVEAHAVDVDVPVADPFDVGEGDESVGAGHQSSVTDTARRSLTRPRTSATIRARCNAPSCKRTRVWASRSRAWPSSPRARSAATHSRV